MKSHPSQFARNHPVLTFLLINFAWTWAFWLAGVPLRGRNDLLLTIMVMIGGYGPALGGIVTLAIREGLSARLVWRRAIVMGLASLLIFGIIALRYLRGNIPAYDTLATDLTLTPSIVGLAIFTSLVGGWTISSVGSGSTSIRARMGSLLSLRPVNWAVVGLMFYPVMILLAWGLASWLGMGVEYPALWGSPVLEVLPLYGLTFILVALTQGGMEEPGWRGFMQPELQTRFSPLVAALIVSLAWSLWHLPLYLNGFYAGDLVGGMVGGGIYRVLLSIFMAWFYNHSKGNLFLMVFMHTCFNVMVNFLPTSDLGLLILWLAVVIGVVLKDRMYRKPSLSSIQTSGGFRHETATAS